MRRCIIPLAFALVPGAVLAEETGDRETCDTRGRFAAPPGFEPIEFLPDGRVTFRICAPRAGSVRVVSNDISDAVLGAGAEGGAAMAKDEAGLWSATTRERVPADTYRYTFAIDGVHVADPHGTAFALERYGASSTFTVPGADADQQEWRADVPHGVVSEIEYWSDAIGAVRRAHVYTPPGYMKGSEAYPVLYLVNGAGDSDDSWTSVGKAHTILDNLIAAGKAKPMIVVMPAGHTPGRAGDDTLHNPQFGQDLTESLVRHVDATFRTLAQPRDRAMAGLSMGGSHALWYGLTRPDLFRWIGAFSIGFGYNGDEGEITAYETANAAALRRAAREIDLLYYAMGTDDFLYDTVAPTRAIFDRHGIQHRYHESGGGHTWANWRAYLADFAPRLFR